MARRAASADVLIGVSFAVAAVVNELAIDQGSTAKSLLCALAICLGLTIRTKLIYVSVAIVSLALAVSPQTPHLGIDPANLGPLVGAFLAYSVAERAGWFAIIASGLSLVAGLEASSSYVNPLFPVSIIGGTVLARLIRSRRQMAAELTARGLELEQEREIFAHESVRLERARIAHELHDIVAHCISVLVVQAGAGQRLTEANPEAAGEVLTSIAEVAKQADKEISQLVTMLSDELPEAPQPGLALIDELVQRMRAAKLSVGLRLDASIDQMDAIASQACYRVVQESLTNALKHAPGSAISISVLRRDQDAEVVVTNGTPPGRRSGLESAGGGYGSQGMAARLREVNGSVESGPLPDGGWRVRARIPLALTA